MLLKDVTNSYGNSHIGLLKGSRRVSARTDFKKQATSKMIKCPDDSLGDRDINLDV